MSVFLQKLYNHRLRNLKTMARILQAVPFLRCIILTGSMAEGKITPTSDIDILIVAKSGRIFTCRAMVLFWAYISGLKRSSNESKNHAGKFCFNYFLTGRFLIIPHNRSEEINRYCAENYSKSILVWGDRRLFEKYIRINLKWMKKYLTNNSKLKTKNHNSLSFQPTNVSTIKLFVWKAGILEYILGGKFGDRIEKILKKIQVRKIKSDPKLTKQKNLVVFDDKELRFHPPQQHRK